MKTWTKEERYRILQSPEEIRGLHEETKKSIYRQTFHEQPVTGLLNDPNGFIYHDGTWHLFYQWCPWGAVHGLKYWYHTISKDLVTWENKGVCIRPDKEYDNKGAYSGSAYPGSDSLYLYYTGNHRDEDWTRKPNTCLVKLKDDGRIEKLEAPLFGMNPNYTEHQRDPKLIHRKDAGKYNIVIGAESPDHKGRVLIYESEHRLSGWEFRGELKVEGYESFGNMWECPSIERIGNQDVLLFCPQNLSVPGRGGSIHHNGYLLGEMDWETLEFHHDGSFHVLDFGFDSYAAECAANIEDPNKAILVAWMGLPDASYPVTDEENWSGCLTLPRELTVRNRRLIQRPLEALKALREKEENPAEGRLPEACEMELTGAGDAALTLKLFTQEKGEGGVVISYDPEKREISVDRSGMKNRFNTEHGECRTRPLESGLRHLRIFIDHSSLEIFVNDGDAVFTSRAFPEKDEHGFVLEGGADVKLWSLKPAVKDDFIV
ncbi:MAG: sucrose-6-phosphate hydrolase [Lachnospiraceae bacterium]|nr:sucrose-6-phosphate hydrolase [Lachnospiraceae bacterium]